ncbi:hypothetical protein QYF36_016928 [Acer negundo]|nr:hypothetical protein QYF36_016928 [Acer negundo]
MDFVLIFKFNHVGSINVSGEEKQVLQNIESLGNAAPKFTQSSPTFGYGNHDYANFSINEEISFDEGNNTLEGIYAVAMIGLKNGSNDLSSEEWTYQV